MKEINIKIERLNDKHLKLTIVNFSDEVKEYFRNDECTIDFIHQLIDNNKEFNELYLEDVFDDDSIDTFALTDIFNKNEEDDKKIPMSNIWVHKGYHTNTYDNWFRTFSFNGFSILTRYDKDLTPSEFLELVEEHERIKTKGIE